MEVKKEIRDEIIARAERVIYYNELLIEQCNSWLPAEEGNRIMEERILESIRKEKEEKRKLNPTCHIFPLKMPKLGYSKNLYYTYTAY